LVDDEVRLNVGVYVGFFVAGNVGADIVKDVGRGRLFEDDGE